jgi:hypothetical protein
MADTNTTNLSLVKPEVGASTDTWGGKINDNLDDIDDVFKADGTGTSVGLNVGAGKTLSVAGTLSGAGFDAFAPKASPEFTGAIYDNGSVRGNIVAVAALDIDCSEGNYFTKTIAGDSTFTFSNAPASRSYAFTLELTQTSGNVTWPAAVTWPKDTPPTLTAGNTHIFVFVTDDGGTRWRGAALVDYIN